MARYREFFYGLGIPDISGFDLIDALSSVCWEKNGKKKNRKEK
jgi:hypothetical protein